MDAKQIRQIVGAIFGMIFRLLFTLIMVMLVYRAAMEAYNFGYLIFADVPMELSPGTDKVVTIADGADNWEIAKTLEKDGVVNSAGVFYVQVMLSDYKENLKPGMHELNSSMKSEEIIKVMAGVTEEEDEEEE